MNLPIIACDAETYYDTEYSLKRLTTEEYIRDPRFELIGWSIWMPDRAAPTWYPGEAGAKAMQAIDWSRFAMLNHNAWFDGAIAAWHHSIRPKLHLDSMAMAQPLYGFTTGVSLAKLSEVLGVGVKGDEVVRAAGKHLADFTPQELAAYGRYCSNDTVLTRGCFEKLLPFTLSKELALIDETIRLFTDPRLMLDVKVLEDYYEQVVYMKSNRYLWLGNLLGMGEEDVKTAIMSDVKLAELFRELGVDPPTKLNSKGQVKPAFARTDEEFKAMTEHPDEAIQLIATCRLEGKSTLAESRALRLLGVASRGLLPVQLKYYAAHPGRFGGDGKVNLQNLPRNTKEAKSKLRQAIMAMPFHQCVVGDLSQIEARILCYVAGQDDVLIVFAANDRDPANNPDVYCSTATLLFGRTIDKYKDTLERFVGKTARLGLGYGTGKDKFYVTLKRAGVKCTLAQAAEWVTRFRAASPFILKLWRDAGRALQHLIDGTSFSFGRDDMIVVKVDGIHLPTGLVIRYPGLQVEGEDEFGRPQYSYLNRKKRVRIYGAKVVENIVQSLARSVCTDGWLRLRHKRKVVLQAHDELICVAHDDEVEQALLDLRAALTVPVKYLPGMPIACDTGAARRYGDAKS